MADFPDWQAFQEGGHPEPVGERHAGRIVAVVASEGAVRAGWAADLALRMGGAWGAGGRRVIVADGGLEQPTLHKAAGMENKEGLTDAALFGASVTRVARPFQDRACFLMTAGSPTADVGSVADNPRWRRLLDGFVEAGVTLLLFLRTDGDACQALLPAASDIVLFSERGEEVPAVLAQAADRVRAVTGYDEVVASHYRAGARAAAADEAPIRPGRSPAAAHGERRRGPGRQSPPRPGLRPVPSRGGTGKTLFFVLALMAIAFAAVFLLTSLGAVDGGEDPAAAVESR